MINPIGSSTAGERTAWLECALGVSLLMFGAMLERCCALLPEPSYTQHHADALLLLPAIKVYFHMHYEEIRGIQGYKIAISYTS